MRDFLDTVLPAITSDGARSVQPGSEIEAAVVCISRRLTDYCHRSVGSTRVSKYRQGPEREFQRERFRKSAIRCNAEMTSRHVRKFCELDARGRRLLIAAIERLGLSARAHDRILKVSRTIADLGGCEHIESGHVAEAVQYRALDRAYFSWTLKEKKKARGAEADECYIFGTEPRDRPQLAIEVEWTRGGLDKLDIYRKLGVGEVWIWRKGAIQVYVLAGDEFERVQRSRVLPDLDLPLLTSMLGHDTLTQAVRAYRKAFVAES